MCKRCYLSNYQRANRKRLNQQAVESGKHKRRYQNNSDAERARVREYYRRYQSERQAYTREYYWNNREARIEYNREYQHTHLEVFRAKNARRREFATLGMTAADRKGSVEHRRKIRGNPCFYCGEFAGEMHDDHMNPLSRGGTDHWWNLVRACAPCNLGKGARTAEEFIEEMNLA